MFLTCMFILGGGGGVGDPKKPIPFPKLQNGLFFNVFFVVGFFGVKFKK